MDVVIKVVARAEAEAEAKAKAKRSVPGLRTWSPTVLLTGLERA